MRKRCGGAGALGETQGGIVPEKKKKSNYRIHGEFTKHVGVQE